MLTKTQMRERATTLFERGREVAMIQAETGWTKAPTPQQLVNPNWSTNNYTLGRDESVHAQQLTFAKRGWQYASIRPIATRIASQSLKAVRKPTVRGAKCMEPWEILRLPNRVKQVRYPELEPLASHPLLDVISHPNPFMVQWQLMWATVFSLQATGKAYWWFVQKDGRLQVWPVPASWIKPDNSESLRGSWTITPEGHAGEPYTVPGDEVAFFYMPDPGDPLSAMSSLAAAARPILSDDAIHEAQYQGFQAGHMPDHAFIIGERIDPDGHKRRPELSENQRKELDSRLKQLFGGPRKHGRAILLDGLITDVKKLSMAPEEMAYRDSMKLTEREIEKIFGVNPIMLGEIENANRASATVADSIFLNNVANPLLELVGQVLTEFVHACPFFPGQQNIIVYFDEIVAADPELELKEWQFAADRGMVDINDYRVHRLGLPPLKTNGDIARINITMIDVPVGKPRPPGAESTTVVPPAPERSIKSVTAKTWKRLHDTHEAKLAAVLEGLFQRQAREFEQQIENGVMSAGVIVSTENWSESIKAAVKPALREAAINGASVELELLKSMSVHHTKADELDDRLFGNAGNVLHGIDDYFDNLFKQAYWCDIGDGIEDELDKLLRKFQSEGMSSDKIAREIAAKFEDLSVPRAQRIARTETTSALNLGSHFARIELAETGLVTGKEWNSILDEETRGMDPKDAFNHVLMDGQRVGVKDDFNVDGEMAPFPGHYSLSAGSRCHCRCYTTTVLITD